LRYTHVVRSPQLMWSSLKKCKGLRGLIVGLLVLPFSFAVVSCQGNRWDKYLADGAKAFEQHRYDEAEKWLKAALNEAEGFGSNDPRLATTLDDLAEVYHAQGKDAEAEPLYKRSLVIWERTLGREHAHVAISLQKYATLLRRMNREAEAAALEARAKTIRAKQPGGSPAK